MTIDAEVFDAGEKLLPFLEENLEALLLVFWQAGEKGVSSVGDPGHPFAHPLRFDGALCGVLAVTRVDSRAIGSGLPGSVGTLHITSQALPRVRMSRAGSSAWQRAYRMPRAASSNGAAIGTAIFGWSLKFET